MMDNFKKLEDQYFVLRGKFASHVITQEQFKAELEKLVIEDAQGRRWMLNADDGKWRRYDGQAWVPSDPEAMMRPKPTSLPGVTGQTSPTTRSAPSANMQRVQPQPRPTTLPGENNRALASKPPSSSPLRWILVAGVFLVAICASCAALAIRSGIPIPGQVAKVSPGSTGTSNALLRLSQDQEFLISTLGQPSFFEMNRASGSGISTVRWYDIWYYPKYGASYTFVNGTYAGSDDLSALPADAIVPPWTPKQFYEGMTLEQVSALIGQAPTVTFKIPDGVIPNSVLYEYKGVTAGFISGRLVYLDTAPYYSKTSMVPQPVGPASVTVGSSARKIPGLSAPLLGFNPVEWAIGLFRFSKNVVDKKQKIDNAKGQPSYGEIEEMLTGAAQTLREEAQKTREEGGQFALTDPVKKALYDRAATDAEKAANSLEKEALPELKNQISRSKAGDAWDWVNPISFIPGVKNVGGNQNVLRNLLGQFLKDKSLRPGEVNDSIKEFIQGHFDWDKLDKGFRESLVADVLSKQIKERCGSRPGKLTPEWANYEECFWKKVNEMRGNLKDWTGSSECFDYLKGLQPEMQQRGGSLNPQPRKVPGLAAPPRIACPTRGSTLIPGMLLDPTETPIPTETEVEKETRTPTEVTSTATSTPTLTPTSTATNTTTPLPTATNIPPPPVIVQPPFCPGPPVIAFFTGNPTTITAGQSATLSWGAVTNATAAFLEGEGVPSPGSINVRPSRTSTFTLRATGCGGTVSRQVTIVVNSPPVSRATATVSAGCKFTGSWNVAPLGPLTQGQKIVQVDNITWRFGPNNSYTIVLNYPEGTALKGTWSTGFGGPNNGAIEINMSADCKSFTGRWKNESPSDGNWHNWSGNRSQ